jgi:hypothetical protein
MERLNHCLTHDVLRELLHLEPILGIILLLEDGLR